MKVDNFFFSWRHEQDCTYCFVYLNPPAGKLSLIPPIVVGISKLNPKDHYDNKVGRKVSLLKALQELTKEKLISGDFRPRAWEVFRTMTKEPRWKVKEE